MHVYADNAATTSMHQTAIDTMTYHLNNTFGNPSSLYTIGQQAKEVLETCLLYTSPSPRDRQKSRMPSSA